MLHRTPTDPTGRRTLTFTLPPEWAGRVSVVGNFNEWTPGRLVLVEEDGVARGAVVLPHDYVAVFRYLGEGGHWFDEPAADFVDGGGSVVLGAPGPEPVPDTPATKAERVAAKRRREAEKAAGKAAEKQRKASGKLADRARKAAEKQRKAAEKVSREREKAARKLAKRDERAGRDA